jgi:hypothetical protein
MNAQELRDALAKIHAELEHAPKLDAQARQLLQEIIADVERIPMNQPVDVSGGRSVASRSRLEALAVRFEADHPVLAAELRQIVGMLSNIGV